MASLETIKAYRASAHQKIRRAQSLYPELRPLEALFRFVSEYEEKLTPNSARLWRQELRIAVAELAEADDRDLTVGQRIEAQKTLNELVDALRGRPKEPRTSTKKRKDPPKAEVVRVFARMKVRALELHRARMAATAIYCVLMPRIGARPLELVGARVERGILVLPNAKRASEQAAERPIRVGHWELQHRVALAALIDFVNGEVQAKGYDAWLSIVAETLARACEAVKVKRLSPSSFRHTALSTWSAAGYSTEEIALLAGHFCRRSALHYIRTASAWGPEDAVVPSPGPMQPASNITEPAAESATAEFNTDPMPMPSSLPSKSEDSQKLMSDYRSRRDQYDEKLARSTQRLLAERMHSPGKQVPPASVKLGKHEAKK